MSDGRGGGGGVGWGEPSTTQGPGGFQAGVGFPHLSRWPLRPHSFFAGSSPRFTGCKEGIPRQLEAKVGATAAFQSPSPAPASLASLYLSRPSPGACPSPALCGSAVWPLKRNVGLACGSVGHIVVGASPAAWLRSLASFPMGIPNGRSQFICPYFPGPNLSALSCC